MSETFDAWFLDGFAPARNPAMWSPEVFAHIARLSAPGARLATFTVAGDVRRGLESAGFAVEKKPGFGSKRERLEASLANPAPVAPSIYPYAATSPKRVAIIGAGIAGAATAYALTQRGVETIVLEAAPDLGAGASGNPAGLVMPRLDRGDGAPRELFLAAYLRAIATYEQLAVLTACGVEERPEEGDEALADLLADPPLPADWFAPLPGGSALHPRAGLVRPRAAIDAMLARAQLMCEAPVSSLERAGDGWILRAPDNRAMLKADCVILACGAGLAQFEPAQFLPLTMSYGQIEWGRAHAPATAITRSNYVAPFDGGILFGATFDKTPADPSEARARNLAALTALAPEIAASIDPTSLQSRASVRVTTPDRMPIAGLLPDAPAWLKQYEPLAHGAKVTTNEPPPAHAGVYVIAGLGARGLTLAPLLGEQLASEICGDPNVLSQRARDAIHPARFLHRALKRR
jgi:tRNA 5-methylaminomethyl-2-thiouridine biosynthesis bifunctional protein